MSITDNNQWMPLGKTRKWYRPPTAAEIAAFDGLHCHVTYRQVRDAGWRCPCCRRSALIRWSEIRGPYRRKTYGDQYGMGFTILLAHHHCHCDDCFRGTGRFDLTLICGDCNSANGAVKRKLGLPAEWSFAPHEIAQFVSTTVHSGRTVIDYDIARRLWEDATQDYNYRNEEYEREQDVAIG